MVGAREFAVDSVYKIVPWEKSLQGLGGFRLVGWLGLAVRGGSRKIPDFSAISKGFTDNSTAFFGVNKNYPVKPPFGPWAIGGWSL